MSWVRKVSISPTSEMARAVGSTMPRVSRLKGTFMSSGEPKGQLGTGSPVGRSPRPLTVGIPKFSGKLKTMEMAVNTTMATS